MMILFTIELMNINGNAKRIIENTLESLLDNRGIRYNKSIKENGIRYSNTDPPKALVSYAPILRPIWVVRTSNEHKTNNSIGGRVFLRFNMGLASKSHR